MPEPLLEVRDLRTVIQSQHGNISVVNGVSFRVRRGETFGLVGESGCGKTTLALTLVRLIEPSEGSILFRNIDLTALSQRQMKEQRRHIQIVFQDPFGSLPSRLPITAIISEPLEIFSLGNPRERRRAVEEMLDAVGLSKLKSSRRFAHELSGGEHQRVAIARALITKPDLVILDEPVSSLDVSIQAQVLSLLRVLQRQFGLAYIFISHDLRVIGQMCNRIAVMYSGKIVETADVDKLFSNPLHPYTQALMRSLPTLDIDRPFIPLGLPGQPPSGYDSVVGCVFNSRCPISTAICFSHEPPLVSHQPAHDAACHNVGSQPAKRVDSVPV